MPFAEGCSAWLGFRAAKTASRESAGPAAPICIRTGTGLELRFNAGTSPGSGVRACRSERDVPSAPKQEHSQPLSG